MKKLILSAVTIFCATNLFAQKPKLEISATPSLVFPFKEVDSKMSYGVGAKANLVFRDDKNFNVLVGLAYQLENYKYRNEADIVFNEQIFYDHLISAQYVSIPLGIRIKLLKGIYVETSCSMAYNIAIRDKIKVSGRMNNSEINKTIIDYDDPEPSSRLTSSASFCFGRSFELNRRIGLFTQLGYSQMIVGYQNDYDNAGVVEFDTRKGDFDFVSLKVPKIYLAVGLRF